MSIYKVVISFLRDHMQHMSERGVLAMTPGEALDLVIRSLSIPIHAVESFKSWVSKPEALGDFSRDAVIMNAIGSDMSVRDLWRRKHGE